MSPTNKNPEEDDCFWHYASVSALLGMIEQRPDNKDISVWATSIRFLNDASELLHGETLFVRDVVGNDEHRKATWASRRASDLLFYRRSFAVFCLSTLSDDLAQWRAYTPVGGVAIGFDRIGLQKYAVEMKWNLEACTYEGTPENEKRIVELHESMRAAIEKNPPRAEHPLWTEAAANIWLMSYWKHIPFMKDRAFEAENEWRVSCQTTSWKWRPGKTLAIPYMALPIPRTLITRIKVGPTSHAELAEMSVRNLATDLGLGLKEVTSTRIPFRGSM